MQHGAWHNFSFDGSCAVLPGAAGRLDLQTTQSCIVDNLLTTTGMSRMFSLGHPRRCPKNSVRFSSPSVLSNSDSGSAASNLFSTKRLRHAGRSACKCLTRRAGSGPTARLNPKDSQRFFLKVGCWWIITKKDRPK